MEANYTNRMHTSGLMDDFIVGEKNIAAALNIHVSTLHKYKKQGMPIGKMQGNVIVEKSKLKNWIINNIVY